MTTSSAWRASPSGVDGHSSTWKSLRSTISGGIRSPDTSVFSVKWIGSPNRANRSSTDSVFSTPQYPWCMCDWSPSASNRIPASRQSSIRCS